MKLHAKYTTDYPDTPPELHLVNPHCLSEDLVKILLKEIEHLANEKLGEVSLSSIIIIISHTLIIMASVMYY